MWIWLSFLQTFSLNSFRFLGVTSTARRLKNMDRQSTQSESIDQTAAELLFIGVLLLVSIALFSSCATSPKGRKQLILFPEDQIQQMGLQSFQQIKQQTPVDSDPQTNAYVKCVANAITNVAQGDNAPKAWEVVVFKDDTANAFALPGGKIGVNTGLLSVAKTPAQLAAVLGHEVGHVLARHGNERVSEQFGAQLTLGAAAALLGEQSQKSGLLMAALGTGAQYGVLLPHSRSQESEADLIGLDLMAKAGFQPEQSVELWKNMEQSGGGQPPEFLSTHPSHGTRMQNLQSHMGEADKLYAKASSHPNCQR